jgi:WxL domain surface cell wall-binding
MRKLMLFASTIVLVGFGTAIPAGADVTGGTPATFTLTAGALSISVPVGPVSLGSQAALTTSSTLSGSLGVVTVTDQRGGTTTWTVSVISGAFTPTGGPADPATNLSYAAGTITQSANVVATAVAASDLSGQSTVVTASSSGLSTASWDPTITVIIPANFAPGVYGATITHSVA